LLIFTFYFAFGAIVFNDEFTDSTGTLLQNHTPNTGSGWTKLLEGGTCDFKTDTVLGATNKLTHNSCSFNEGALYQTNDTISSSDYSVSISMDEGNTADDYKYLACRIQDSNNLYVAEFNEDGSQLWKKTSGSWSSLVSTTTDIANFSVVKLVCSGTTISLEDDDVEVLSTTDSTHTSAGKAGIGMGNIGRDTSSDIGSLDRLDSFNVDTIITEEETEFDPIIMSTTTDAIIGETFSLLYMLLSFGLFTIGFYIFYKLIIGKK
jgi:hypothetical protein